MIRYGILLSLLMFFLQGCFHQKAAIIVQDISKHRTSSGYHTVRPGDTLYAIAWQHNMDYRVLAQKNGLKAPYALKIGQQVRVKFKAAKPSSYRARSSSRGIKRRQNVKRLASASAKSSTIRRGSGANKNWLWPVTGKIIQKYSMSNGCKGINISGYPGQVIRATQSGRVAYAGEGLRGYGKLLIIKHNDLYLSAYAHNRDLLVREGAWVKAGQGIARMGKTGSRRVMLHFEIRRSGLPVDPLRYLPQKG